MTEQGSSGIESRKHVALFIETSGGRDSGMLEGIRRYAEEHPAWAVTVCDLREKSDLSWLARWRGHGILARIENERLARTIARLNLPTVALSEAGEVPDLPSLATAGKLTAVMAVNFLLDRDIRSFAAFGDTGHLRSDGVDDYFRTILADKGFPCCSYSPEGAGKSEMEKKLHIAKWLDELPKPAGVLACSQEALFIEACNLAGCAIPEEVAVIGFAQGDTLCELIDSRLSSIIATPAKTGYEAAAALEAMMAEQERSPAEPHDMSIAESEARKDKWISDALDFIYSKACDGITVMDLLREVPLSRRMLEHKFRKLLGRTPHEEILAAKLRRVKQLLAETNLPLIAIADRSGFKHTEYLSVAFKREVGVSPSRYRKQYQMRIEAERERLRAQH